MAVKTLEHEVSVAAKLVQPFRTEIFVSHSDDFVFVGSEGILAAICIGVCKQQGIVPPPGWSREITITNDTVKASQATSTVTIQGIDVERHFVRLTHALRDAPERLYKAQNKKEVNKVREILAELARDIRERPTEFTIECL